jgi:NDP-sugar pyrophosphorylase family protein
MRLHFGAVHPEVRHNKKAAFTLNPIGTTTNGWEKTLAVPLGETPGRPPIALIAQAPGATTDVTFHQGNGGFAAIVTTNDLTYIAIPGSKIRLPDTLVVMPEASPLPSHNVPRFGTTTHAVASMPVLSSRPQTIQTVTTQAMILGAGLATRSEPVSGETTGYSKPALPLVGQDSVIVHLAKHLQHHGIRKIIVNTFYMPDQLKQQLRKGVPGMEFQFIDEKNPSGPAGGLFKALQQDGVVDKSQPLLVMQGDCVTDADISYLLNAHRHHGAKVTLGVQRVPDEQVSKVGIVGTDRSGGDGESGWVEAFHEKPSLAEAGDNRLGSIGFYVLEPDIFPFFQETGVKTYTNGKEYDYANHFFPAVLKDRIQKRLEPAIWAQRLGGYWSDIGAAKQYIETTRILYANAASNSQPQQALAVGDNPGVVCDDKGVVYWPGTRLLAQQAGAKLEGHVVVAKRLPEGLMA